MKKNPFLAGKFKLTCSDGKDYGLYTSHEEATKQISKLLAQRNFKSYYSRWMQVQKNKLCIDYGSYVHFFYIEEMD